MSFQSLRKERESRQRIHKSFIEPNSAFVGSSNVQEAGPSLAVEVLDQLDSNSTAASYENLFHDLGSKVEIRISSAQGRGLYATQPIAKGAAVFKTKPHVAVLSAIDLPSHCSNCFSPTGTESLKKCTKCQVVMYCSSTCQSADWGLHKHECKAIRKWLPSKDYPLPSEPVRCIARILWAIKDSESDVIKKEMQNLVSHRQYIPPSAFASHTHVAHSLIRYLNASSPDDMAPYGLSSASDLVDLISRFATNSFALTTPSLTPIGVVVSPLTALVNHSCDPNVAIVFPRAGTKAEEPLMKTVALRNIERREQILVSYIDTTLPRASRQKVLQETYIFKCDCTLCSRDWTTSDVDLREVLRCPKACGGLCRVPQQEENNIATCTQCKNPVKSQAVASVQDLIRVGQEALDKATALEAADPPRAIHITRNMLALFASSSLAPTSHPYLAMNRLHVSLLIAMLGSDPESIDEAIRTSATCVSALRDLLPEGHPARAVAMAELGKLLAVDEPSFSSTTGSSSPTLLEQVTSCTSTSSDVSSTRKFPPTGEARLRLAHETLIRALAELEMGYGAGGGEVGATVRDLARQVDKELAAWTTGVRNVRASATR